MVNLESSEVPVTVTVGIAHKVECATCHNVHKAALSDKAEDNYALLVMKLTGGQLCLTCYQK